MSQLLLVASGGALGAVMRYASGALAVRVLGQAFPFGTIIVNVIGSLLMGVLVAWMVKRGGSTELRLFLATGLLGGFTTFSAFSLDFSTLLERGDVGLAFVYVFLSVGLSLIAIFAGLWFGRLAL